MASRIAAGLPDGRNLSGRYHKLSSSIKICLKWFSMGLMSSGLSMGLVLDAHSFHMMCSVNCNASWDARIYIRFMQGNLKAARRLQMLSSPFFNECVSPGLAFLALYNMASRCSADLPDERNVSGRYHKRCSSTNSIPIG